MPLFTFISEAIERLVGNKIPYAKDLPEETAPSSKRTGTQEAKYKASSATQFISDALVLLNNSPIAFEHAEDRLLYSSSPLPPKLALAIDNHLHNYIKAFHGVETKVSNLLNSCFSHFHLGGNEFISITPEFFEAHRADKDFTHRYAMLKDLNGWLNRNYASVELPKNIVQADFSGMPATNMGGISIIETFPQPTGKQKG